MSQEITTIQQLADLIGKNQEKTDKKFESIDRKFDNLTELVIKNQEKTDEKFENITEIMIQNFDKVEEKFENLTELMVKSFDSVYKDISETKTEIRNVESRLGDKISKIEYNTAKYETRTTILEDKVRKINNATDF